MLNKLIRYDGKILDVLEDDFEDIDRFTVWVTRESYDAAYGDDE